MTDNEVMIILDNISTIPNNKAEWGIKHTFSCVCGGKLEAIRSKFNGHLYAKCDSCGFILQE